ncbi:DNA-formamidopyrimidine glycosylase [Patescibacteria group bacterium]|nr:DNA-formamidopyrimidine glycosylase [Patescibacteria group bacterium]
MPELPEVETVKRKLQPIARKVISSFWDNWPNGLKAAYSSKQISADMHGRRTLNISRHGKVVLIVLSSKKKGTARTERLLAFHLRMSGRLYLSRHGEKMSPRESKHVHAVILFTDGTELRFHDPRKFGLVWYGTPEQVKSYRYFTDIGPDALGLDFGTFRTRLLHHRGMIKPLLLRQDFIAGVGNIVADETLWASKIHPRKRVEQLSTAQIRLIYKSLQTVLRNGIMAGGTTLRDWKHPDNMEGQFQKHMKVYGRRGQVCPRCGKEIRRIVVGSRGTWICDRCQKL